MVGITNLETQVQNRIDNLTGTETLEQLLELKRASEFISVDTAALDTEIEARISSFDGSTDKIDLLLGNRLAINPYAQCGYGFTPAPTTNYSQENGGLFGQTITGLNITSKAEVISGLGKFLIFHLHCAGMSTGVAGTLNISLNIDGVDICSDLDTRISESHATIYSTVNNEGGTLSNSSGVMPPLLVNESFSLSLQRNGAAGARIYALIIPVE